MSSRSTHGEVPEAARAGLRPRPSVGGSPSWCLAEVAGRVLELTGWRSGAVYSSAIALVVDAQRSGEPAIWVGPRTRSFHPPDAEAAGVDLAAFPVVRLESTHDLAFAADVLARSGAFGLIVLDAGSFSLSMGMLSRLAGLARTHSTAIAILTEKPAERPSLASVVSFRADTSFARRSDGSFAHEMAVTRDRARAMAWRNVELRRGPPGLS